MTNKATRMCPDHKVPLKLNIKFKVWQCPATMTKDQQEKMKWLYPDKTFSDDTPCFYHVHEEE